MPTPEIPADVHEAAYGTYLNMDGAPGMEAPVAAAVAYAYRAGRESMMPKPKPPTVAVKLRGTCTACGKNRALTLDGKVRGHNEPKSQGQRWPDYCPGGHNPPKEVAG
jgi:hypothetical protein